MRALQRISRRLLFRSAPERSAAPVLRGTLRTAVVVKTPDTQFSEAVFVLRGDATQQKGVTRDELLEEAKAAAAGCAERMLPPRGAPVLRPAAAFLLGAAAALLAMWALGIL